MLRVAKSGLRPTLLCAVILSAIGCGSGFVEAQDWMQFLGDRGAAKSESVKIPKQWGNAENIRWKTALPGRGASSPIIVGDRIFLTSYSGYGDGTDGRVEDLVRHVHCFDRTSGKQLWQKSIDSSEVKDEDPYESFITHHGYATNTPVSDGKSLFVYLGKPGLFAFDLDGNQQWHKKFDYKINKTRWGSAASPILFGENLILNAIEECGKVYSISKSDGQIQWEFEANTKLAYATPNVVMAGDGSLELILPVPTRVIGLDPNTGSQKWFANNKFENESNASVIVDDDIVYIYGGYQSVGSMAIRTGGSGDVTESNVLWNTRDTSYVSTPILKEGHLYWVDENGIAFCVKAGSGEQIYKRRLGGIRAGRGIKFFASMIQAGDHMIAVSRRSGTYVIKTQPQFELVSHNIIEGDDSEFNGTPAISGDQLYIRSNKFLYCIGD